MFVRRSDLGMTAIEGIISTGSGRITDDSEVGNFLHSSVLVNY